ncbi:MAG: hypothetical protein AB7I38_14485 [Dehalococcoidia bacterium]
MSMGYTTPDAVRIWQDFWPIILVLAAGAGWSWRRSRRRWAKFKTELVGELVGELKQATKPIQPDTNGGKSLPDLHIKVDALQSTLAKVETNGNNTAAALLEHIANHRPTDTP